MPETSRSGIEFTDIAENRLEERFSDDGVIVIRRVRCEWSKRWMLQRDLRGYVIGTTQYFPQRLVLTSGVNAADWYSSTVPLFVRKVNIKPFPIVAEDGAELAELELEYGTLPYATPPGGEEPVPPPGATTYVTESLEPAAEFLTLPTKEVYINGTLVEETGISVPARVMTMTDWVYTIHAMTYLPDSFFTCPGTINSAAIKSYWLGYTFAAQTLLCGNPSSIREITSEGITTWAVTFRFTYRQEGWNKFPYWNPGAGTTPYTLEFGTLYDGTTGSGTDRPLYPYPISDFTDIPFITLA